MRQLFLVVLLALCGPMLGQFIPQPNEYNPDVDADEFISVVDLQGMLALFSQPFANSDSLSFTTWNFPDDYGDALVTANYAHLSIESELDFAYISQNDQKEVRIYLPEGTGYKTLQLFLSTDSLQSAFFRVGCGEIEDSSNYWGFYGGAIEVFPDYPVALQFIRGHNGRWHQVGVH